MTIQGKPLRRIILLRSYPLSRLGCHELTQFQSCAKGFPLLWSQAASRKLRDPNPLPRPSWTLAGCSPTSLADSRAKARWTTAFFRTARRFRLAAAPHLWKWHYEQGLEVCHWSLSSISVFHSRQWRRVPSASWICHCKVERGR